MCRYYIRIANQLLVEDKDSGQDSRGFVILTADLNLKLVSCHKGKGVDDFTRLINEGINHYINHTIIILQLIAVFS